MSSSSSGVIARAPRLAGGRRAGVEAAGPLWRWWAWTLAAAAVIGGAVAIVLLTGMTPSFDAYGWLIWGHQLLYGNLNLNSAPSWKPLMIIFTLPMSLFGGATPPLLLSIAMVAGTLAMAPFAGRIAYRLAVDRSGGIPTRRLRAAAWIGALFAAVGVLGMQGYGLPVNVHPPPQSLWRLTFIADSDPLAAAIVLAAVDAHISRRPRLAYVLLFVVGLNRPEAWPLMILYGIWLMWRVPGTRLVVVGTWVLTLVAWYLPTAVAAKSIFEASKLDEGKAVAIKGEPVLPVLRRWLTYYEWPMQAAAVLGMVVGAARRDRRVLTITAAAALWLLVEMAFAYHGFSAVARYMIEPAALMIVVAGYGIAQALAGPGQGAGRAWRWTAGLLGPALAVGLIAGLGYFLHLRQARVRKLVPAVHNFGIVKAHLSQAIAKAGGPKAILACGPPAALNGYQTQLAWSMNVNGDQVMFNPYGPHGLLAHHQRMVLFTETGANGWVVRPHNVPAPLRARCARTVSVTVPSS